MAAAAQGFADKLLGAPKGQLYKVRKADILDVVTQIRTGEAELRGEVGALRTLVDNLVARVKALEGTKGRAGKASRAGVKKAKSKKARAPAVTVEAAEPESTVVVVDPVVGGVKEIQTTRVIPKLDRHGRVRRMDVFDVHVDGSLLSQRPLTGYVPDSPRMWDALRADLLRVAMDMGGTASALILKHTHAVVQHYFDDQLGAMDAEIEAKNREYPSDDEYQPSAREMRRSFME